MHMKIQFVQIQGRITSSLALHQMSSPMSDFLHLQPNQVLIGLAIKSHFWKLVTAAADGRRQLEHILKKPY